LIIVVAGLSHKTAPVEVRENLAFPEKEMDSVLASLLKMEGVEEGMIISTCNRVELYASGKKSDEPKLLDGLVQFMSDYHNYPVDSLREHLYVYRDEEAVRHVLRVTSSLDSMVVGEAQILGQVKEFYETALRTGSTGKILNKLLKKAFSVAKEVRTRTGIARNAVSISFAAVELARKIFGELSGRTVMIIGAGEMSELAAKHLVSNGCTDVLVVNRTFEKAVALARGFDGSAVRFEDLAENMAMSDIVISSTGAPGFILSPEMMKGVLAGRRNKPMFLIDIAVPRDIDPGVNDQDNIYLYDIDDLESVVQSNIKERQKEAQKAEEIVAQEVGVFTGWMESLQVYPTIVGLRQMVEGIKQAELDKALSRLGDLDEKDLQVVKGLASGIINKILHQPITVLKTESRGGNSAEYIDAVQKLFGISTRPEGEQDDN
jgi:glutamyl-tRNA reductase